MELADKHTRMYVRTNADTPKDARVARGFGAKGIGLCRTEHMFFEGDRIKAMREMILAEDEPGRRKALKKLLPIQRADFEGIFEAMHDLPVTVDCLIHLYMSLFRMKMKINRKWLRKWVLPKNRLKGKWMTFMNSIQCSVIVDAGWVIHILKYPKPARAIIEAAMNLKKKGIRAIPEIMIPLTGTLKEYQLQEEIIRQTAEKVFEERKDRIDYLVVL